MNNVARVFFVAAWKIAPMMKAAPAIIIDLSNSRAQARSGHSQSHGCLLHIIAAADSASASYLVRPQCWVNHEAGRLASAPVKCIMALYAASDLSLYLQ